MLLYLLWGMKTTYFTSLSLSAVHSFSLVTFEARQWLLPREANFSHMFLTFIPSNGPICLSKCVCCVLFPARFVPMPSLQWAPLSPGVWAEASRYLYRPNSWGPPSQSSEGWREKLSWKLQVKPSVGNVSLFPLFYSLVLLSVICLPPMGVQSGQVRLCSAQVNWTARQTSLTCLSSHLQSHIYLSVLFSFYIHTATYVFSLHFPPLKYTFFPRFQLKRWLFWTGQERLIFPPTAPQHILSLCCTGQSRPAVAKLSFLCFFPFLLLCGSCSACPLLWISTLWSSLLAAFLFYLFHPVFTSLWSYRAFARPFCLPLSAFFLMWTAQEGRQSWACRYFLQFKACVAVRRPITGVLS